MEIVQLLVLVLVCGIVWYFLEPYVKSPFREILIVLFVLIFCLWLLTTFGILDAPPIFRSS